MTVKEAKRHVEALQELRKDLDTLHDHILKIQEELPETFVCDGSIIDAIAYLKDYEIILTNAIDNAKIPL